MTGITQKAILPHDQGFELDIHSILILGGECWPTQTKTPPVLYTKKSLITCHYWLPLLKPGITMKHLFRKNRFLSFFVVVATLVLTEQRIQSQTSLSIRPVDTICNNMFNVQKEDMPRLLGSMALVSTLKSFFEWGIERKVNSAHGPEFLSFSKHRAAQTAYHVTSILCAGITLSRLLPLKLGNQEVKNIDYLLGLTSLILPLGVELNDAPTWQYLGLWSFFTQGLINYSLASATAIALKTSQRYFDATDSHCGQLPPPDFSRDKYIVIQSPRGIWLSSALEIWQHNTPTPLTSLTKYGTEKALTSRHFIRISALEKLPKDVAQAFKILASNYQMLMLNKLSPSKLTWSFNERQDEQHDYERKLFGVLKQAKRLSPKSPDTISSLTGIKKDFPDDYEKVSEYYNNIVSLPPGKRPLREIAASLVRSPEKAAYFFEKMKELTSIAHSLSQHPEKDNYNFVDIEKLTPYEVKFLKECSLDDLRKYCSLEDPFERFALCHNQQNPSKLALTVDVIKAILKTHKILLTERTYTQQEMDRYATFRSFFERIASSFFE